MKWETRGTAKWVAVGGDGIHPARERNYEVRYMGAKIDRAISHRLSLRVGDDPETKGLVLGHLPTPEDAMAVADFHELLERLVGER